MALLIQQPKYVDHATPTPTVGASTSAEPDVGVADSPSRARVGLVVMAVSIFAVLAITTAMMLAITDVSFAAALGLGLYCAFWLGIGFGTIFGAAAAFGRDH